MRRLITATVTAAATLAAVAGAVHAPSAVAAKSTRTGFVEYHYGNAADVTAPMSGGQLLSGGGIDDPEAMHWLLGRGGGKVDVVVLDAYGPDIYGEPFMVWGADSVDSYVFSSRAGASDPAVLAAIDAAEVIWLDGGDQSNYVNYWDGTPLQAHVNARVADGAAFGGMSAGLAVQGGWVYSAMNGSATSDKVLANPYDRNVTLRGALFDLPWMGNTLTDTHFAIRDRMGRLLGFLGRLEEDFGASAPRAIAVDEDSSIGIDAKTGDAVAFGTGRGAWFVATDTVSSRIVAAKTPLTFGAATVSHMGPGDTFNLGSWSGSGLDTYTVSATGGVLDWTAPGTPY